MATRAKQKQKGYTRRENIPRASANDIGNKETGQETKVGIGSLEDEPFFES